MSDPATKSSSNSNSLMPPPSNGGLLAPTLPVAQKLNSGSATGNPRNKCALQPGHSLMDWIRLGNSGIDLSGTCGRIMPISSEELGKHNTRQDAWMAIRGKVYNVTRYMDFHPGGVDELMRGIGSDATKLFEEIHAWVNYQQLLQKCYIGPLRTAIKNETEPSPKPQSTKTNPLDDIFSTKTPRASDIVPRFDWIQKRGEITIYIYTKQFCNPGLIVQRKSENELQLHVQIENIRHIFDIELQHGVEWPPRETKIGHETCKIEVSLAKSSAELWTNYGAHTVRKSIDEGLESEPIYDFEIVKLEEYNHDSFELGLRAIKQIVMLLPIGYHLDIADRVDGELVRRPYTPIDIKYIPKDANAVNNTTDLNFLIKSYSNGLLSRHIQKLQLGAVLLLSPPKANFKLQQLVQHRRIALLAAGSGLTPCLSLVEPLLKRSTNRLEHLQLMYFNKSESDIWCRTKLETLQVADERFAFISILSQPTDDWSGLKGHIRKELLTPLADKNATEHVTFVILCGPSGFIQKAEELLKELKFKTDCVHIF